MSVVWCEKNAFLLIFHCCFVDQCHCNPWHTLVSLETTRQLLPSQWRQRSRGFDFVIVLVYLVRPSYASCLLNFDMICFEKQPAFPKQSEFSYTLVCCCYCPGELTQGLTQDRKTLYHTVLSEIPISEFSWCLYY